MKRIFLLFLCAALLTGVAGCGDEPQTDPIGTPEESYAEQYVVDPVINRFILAFNKQERYVLAGMVQNADLSCTAYVDICQVTMVATQQGLHFSLTGGNTIEQQNRMLDIFYSIAQVIDPSCTDAQAQTAVDHFKSQTDVVTNHRVSNYVSVNAYVPIVHMDTVQVDCRMEFTATNYLPED